MEILLAVPFALFAGMLYQARTLSMIHFPDDRGVPRIDHVPKNDSWAVDVERFDLMLAPHRRRQDEGPDRPGGPVR